MNSIIQQVKECYLCNRQSGLHCHHIFFGSNRNNSEKYGLKVWLCGYHHNLGGEFCVHQNRELDLMFKELAQREFEKTHTREEFREIFGKSWL